MKNSHQRLQLPLLILLVAGLALGSFWLLEVIHKGAEQAGSSAIRTAPDYYIDQFNFVQISEAGQPRYSIAGEKLVHFPVDDSSEIQRPVVNRLEKDVPPMKIYADRARIEDNDSKIHMKGNVNVDRPATSMAQYFHLKSEYLLVLPDDDVMQTDQPVALTLGKSVLYGTGMFVNNATREFRLSSKVRGTYQAPSK